MRRRTGELVTFSMSALDLFACALGAFIMIAIILLPYYLKHEDVVRDNNTLKQQAQSLEDQLNASAQALAAAEAEAAQSAEALAAAQAAAEAARAAAAAAQAKARDAEKQADKNASTDERLAAAQAALKQAQAEVERRVKFALLGLATNAQTFLIVIDMSGSMHEFEGITLETVQRILEPMSEREQVGILGYQALPLPFGGIDMQFHYWPGPGGIAPMQSGNKQLAVSHVRSLLSRVAGGTPTLAGMLRALDYNVDAVVLLSDGAPTIPDGNWRSVVQQVTAKNRGAREIHAVALGPYYRDRDFVAFLSQLARSNRGNFTGIASP